MADSKTGTTAQATPGNNAPALSAIQATVTGTIIQLNNFKDDNGDPVCGARVAFMGGNAYVHLNPETIKQYGEGEEVTIGCGMIERRGDYRPTGKWKIIGKGRVS